RHGRWVSDWSSDVCSSDLSGATPARLVNPIVERMPTRLWCDDGPRIELPVSLPRPTAPKLAATAAAVPPLDPAVTRSSAYGFFRSEERRVGKECGSGRWQS